MGKVLSSLAINDPHASHRIVGVSKIFGNGILGYYDRRTVGDQLSFILKNDPKADVRVEPHNATLASADGPVLRSTDVEWIVTNDGEIGIKIGDQFFFCYKGESFMYPDTMGSHNLKYRPVDKRELGESLTVYKLKDHEEREIDDREWLPVNLKTARDEVAYRNSLAKAF